MSEIKGQLLGIVLVVAVFGVVGGVLVSAFKTSADNISKKIQDDTIKETTTGSTEGGNENKNVSIDDWIISNDELLTF